MDLITPSPPRPCGSAVNFLRTSSQSTFSGPLTPPGTSHLSWDPQGSKEKAMGDNTLLTPQPWLTSSQKPWRLLGTLLFEDCIQQPALEGGFWKANNVKSHIQTKPQQHSKALIGELRE